MDIQNSQYNPMGSKQNNQRHVSSSTHSTTPKQSKLLIPYVSPKTGKKRFNTTFQNSFEQKNELKQNILNIKSKRDVRATSLINNQLIQNQAQDKMLQSYKSQNVKQSADPRLKGIINEDILKGIQYCQFMSNKVDYKNGFNTIYRKDFRGKSVDLVTVTTPLFQDTHDTLQQVHRLNPLYDPNHLTINRKDFVEKEIPIKTPPPPYKPSANVFNDTTTYSQGFKNWKDYDTKYSFLRPELNVSTLNTRFPMDCRSNYNQTIEKDTQKKFIKHADVNEVKKIQKDCPLQQTYQNDGKTEYQKKLTEHTNEQKVQNYVPYKRYESETQKYEPIEQWPGQYKTVYKNEVKAVQILVNPSTINNISKQWKFKNSRLQY